MSDDPNTMRHKLDYAQLSGKGVSAAVIDSGVVPLERCRFSVCDGIRFYKDHYGVVQADDRVEDTVGHGTACAGIIARKAPDATVFPVKIFSEQLETDLDLFEAAIDWCHRQSIRVVNLSLGTTGGAAVDRLKQVCRRAYENGLILVAAENNLRHKSYPASFPFVLGVAAGKVRSKYGYYFRDGHEVEFVAKGDGQRLHWTEPSFVFLGGTSFAAPHMTALVCLVLESCPDASFEQVRELLACNALSGPPVLADAQRLYSVDRLVQQKLLKEERTLKRFPLSTPTDWIQRAVLFPYSKEMHSLVRFRDLLPFEISAVVDVPGRMTIGKDAGALIGLADAGLPVTSDFGLAVAGADTVVLGYLEELSGIRHKNLLYESCLKAVENGCHIFSFMPLSGREYRKVRELAAKKQLHIAMPMVGFSDYQRIMDAGGDASGIVTPVVGVFGTGPSQGKLTTQLCLRKWLTRAGYKVAQVGTEHHSALFGFDFALPIGYGREQSVQLPTDRFVSLLEAVMRILDAGKPDIVVVGAQSGVVPHDYNTVSDCYTLPTLAFLLGTRPDAYVLVVNSIDSSDYIQDTIHVLRSLGKGEVIALVFSDMKKGIRSGLGRTVVVQERLAAREIEETIERLERQFQVPATEVISQKGQLKLVNAVIDYFAEEHMPCGETAAQETQTG